MTFYEVWGYNRDSVKQKALYDGRSLFDALMVFIFNWRKYKYISLEKLREKE